MNQAAKKSKGQGYGYEYLTFANENNIDMDTIDPDGEYFDKNLYDNLFKVNSQVVMFSDEQIEAINSLITDASNVSTSYLEAKIEQGVPLHDVSYAVVPNESEYSEAIRALQDAGV